MELPMAASVAPTAPRRSPSRQLPATFERLEDSLFWSHHTRAGSTGDSLVHTVNQRGAAFGTAVLPFTPLYGVHFVRFRVASYMSFASELGLPEFGQDQFGQHPMFGCVGVADGVDDHAGMWNVPCPACGMEIHDGGWRVCSNAYQSAEWRGDLINASDLRVGELITVRIDCQSRMVSFAAGANPFQELPNPCQELPRLPFPETTTKLQPWVVSAFLYDAFELVSVECSGRTLWMPEQHHLFPPNVRAYVKAVLRSGYQLAATMGDSASQGAFCQLWVSHVLPMAINSMTDEELEQAHDVPPEEGIDSEDERVVLEF